jgi:hypothetical protein
LAKFAKDMPPGSYFPFSREGYFQCAGADITLSPA